MLDDNHVSKQAQLYTEFYKGFMLAADTLSHRGAPVKIYAFDSAANPDTVKAIMENPQACALLLPEDIGVMVSSLRKIVGTAIVAASTKKTSAKKPAQKKMTAAERYIAKNEEAELRELKKEIVKIQKKQELMGTLDPKDAIKIQNYQQQEEKYIKWLQGFEGTSNEEEAPTKKLDTKKAASYLKTAKGDREAAKLLAIQDGYDVEE